MNQTYSVYIGLGSNLNKPFNQLCLALKHLDSLQHCKVTNHSSVYSSDPLDGSDQPEYLNAVVELQTSLTPLQLMRACQEIEQKQGRVKAYEWGPRTIDLDILLYADWILYNNELNIPHRDLMKRAFCIVPLYELVPQLRLPNMVAIQTLYQSVDGLAKQVNLTKLKHKMM